VLQRYGGFAALFRYTDTFDEGGRFRAIPDLPAPDPVPASVQGLQGGQGEALPARACGCVTAGGPSPRSWLAALLITARVMFRRWSDGSSSSRSSSIGGSSLR
jgi:MYXO-CTERM domain-containing protein